MQRSRARAAVNARASAAQSSARARQLNRFGAAGTAAVEHAEADQEQVHDECVSGSSIVAIVENTKLEIGVARLNTDDLTLQMSQFCDDQAYSKTLSLLAQHDPRQLLLPPRAEHSLLERVAKIEFVDMRIEHWPRTAWDYFRGLQHVRHYAHRTEVPALETDVGTKYLCLAALAALIDYAEQAHNMIFVKGALRLKYCSVHGVMLIDPATMRNLELLQNARTGDPKSSVFGVLNHCKTAAGASLLRASLIQPSNDLDTINARLDCVMELLEHEELLADLQKLLPSFAECDRILKYFMQKSNKSGVDRSQAAVASVLHLKHLLRTAPMLGAALASNGEVELQNELLRAMQHNLTREEVAQLENDIAELIEEDAAWDKRTAQLRLQCIFALKSEASSVVKLSRLTLGELTQEMEELAEQYEECAHSVPMRLTLLHALLGTLQMEGLRVKYNQRRGYHLTVPADHRATAEQNGFISIQRQSKKTISCSTERISQRNSRAREAIQQILATTEKEIGPLVDKVRSLLHLLFGISESIALLDMVVAFAVFAQSSSADCVRPEVNEGGPLLLKRSRHPLLESIATHSAIPNNVYITPSSNFQLITGPNMAGKSTYLRQAALLALLAHIGCPVPAEAAEVPLFSRILTRISTSDCLESNASSFLTEMREASYIIKNLGPPVLILVDELGRGTSNAEGGDIAWAIAEEMIAQPQAFTLFATHYLHLANLRNYYPNVKTLCLTVEPTENRLRFLYKITDGVCTKRQYMTDFLAEVAGIPAEVCAHAKSTSSAICFDHVDAVSANRRSEAAYLTTAERLAWHADHLRTSADKCDLLETLKAKLRPQLVREAQGAAAGSREQSGGGEAAGQPQTAVMDEVSAATGEGVSEPRARSDVQHARQISRPEQAPGRALTSSCGSRACDQTHCSPAVTDEESAITGEVVSQTSARTSIYSTRHVGQLDRAPGTASALNSAAEEADSTTGEGVSEPKARSDVYPALDVAQLDRAFGTASSSNCGERTCEHTRARAPLGAGLGGDRYLASRERNDRQVLGRRRLNVDGPTEADSPSRQVPRLSIFTPSPIRLVVGLEISQEAEKDAQEVPHGTTNAEANRQRVEREARKPLEQRSLEESEPTPSNPPPSSQQPDASLSQPKENDCWALLCLASDMCRHETGQESAEEQHQTGPKPPVSESPSALNATPHRYEPEPQTADALPLDEPRGGSAAENASAAEVVPLQEASDGGDEEDATQELAGEPTNITEVVADSSPDEEANVAPQKLTFSQAVVAHVSSLFGGS